MYIIKVFIIIIQFGKMRRTMMELGNIKYLVVWKCPCYTVRKEQSCYKVVASQNLQKRGGGAMGTYEILSLLFLGGTFLVALLTYIDRNNKRK